MNTRFIFNRSVAYKNTHIFVVILLWIVGLVWGLFLALSVSSTSGSLIKIALSTKAIPLFVFFVNSLPIVIISVAIYYRSFWISYPVVLLESVCRGFCGWLIFGEFGNGAWAVRILFLFSGSCISVLMWWLFLRHKTCTRHSFVKDVWFISIAASAISLIDIFIISPFLSNLSNYF